MATPLIMTSRAPISREEYAYETLREAIITGQYLPDQVISQSDTAEQLGISIIPVRSAISRLVAEGLMVQEPHASPRVSSFSSEELREILTIRMHLERLALQLAIPHITPEIISAAKEIMASMDLAAEVNEFAEFSRLNREFHLRLYEASGLPLLHAMIIDLWHKADLHRGRAVFKLAQGQMQFSQDEHRKLIVLIEGKDTERASSLLLEHKRKAMQRFMEALAVH